MRNRKTVNHHTDSTESDCFNMCMCVSACVMVLICEYVLV